MLSEGLNILAQAEGAKQGGGLGSFLIFIPLFGIMYFLMIRPQQKKQKEQQEMLKALKAGDRVRTVGGVLGTIKQITETTVKLEVADGVVIEFLRGAVDKVVTANGEESKQADTKDSRA